MSTDVQLFYGIRSFVMLICGGKLILKMDSSSWKGFCFFFFFMSKQWLAEVVWVIGAGSAGTHPSEALDPPWWLSVCTSFLLALRGTCGLWRPRGRIILSFPLGRWFIEGSSFWVLDRKISVSTRWCCFLVKSFNAETSNYPGLKRNHRYLSDPLGNLICQHTMVATVSLWFGAV